MLAVTIRAHGGPEQIHLADLPGPSAPGPRDVVVALRAAALNHLDLFVLGGMPGLALDFPHVMGADGAGVVEAVGADVRTVKPGDRVILNPGVSCHECEFCRAGEHSLCTTYRLFGEHLDGTFAEALTVPEANAVVIPAHVPWPEAAAFLATITDPLHLVYLIAANAPIEPAEVQKLLEMDSVKDKLVVTVSHLRHQKEVLTLGRKIRSRRRAACSASLSGQKPAPRPARNAAPWAVV
jgi:NADPH:quinone reductase-like Zn-dependent oxidoreductase